VVGLTERLSSIPVRMVGLTAHSLQSACSFVLIKVADSPGPNGTVWRNNSRGLFVALPEGTPPLGGWPVLLDLSILDFPTVSPCGLDGREPSNVQRMPDACVSAARSSMCNATMAAANATSFDACDECVKRDWRHFNELGCSNESLYDVIGPQRPGNPTPLCPSLPPVSDACAAALEGSCPLAKQYDYSRCVYCVESYERNHTGLPNDPCEGEGETAMYADHCGKMPASNGHYIIEDYTPLASPHSMGMMCACLNGA